MRKLLLLLLLLLCLLPAVAFAQAAGQCAGGNCKASAFTATKKSGNSIILSGDAGVLFGDGTSQTTAATAFAGSSASYTATAAAKATAFKSNQGALWCFDPTCTDYMASDGGVAGQSFLTGISLRTRVVDTSGNEGVAFDIYSPSDSTISNATLFDVRNNGSSKFAIAAGGSATISSVTLTGGAVLATSLQASGNATTEVRGGPFSSGTAIAVKISSAQTLNTTGDKIVGFYPDTTTLKASVDKDGNWKSASHITCAMSAGTSCTATVPTGSVCHCQANSTTAVASSCGVSSTTATCTAASSNSETWNIWVW